ncbi:MAG: GreA/GreB family elongation factor [Verrucomicrobiota bacterium]|nr:GreA/GreB family elongation factor [Verrucomicrobiota bacterium]
MRIEKKRVQKRIIDALGKELELYFRAAKAAHAEATHEQSKAENKYDTRGLEASYLARGQSRQAAELEQSIAYFEKLTLRDFTEQDGIDLTAVVELESKGEKAFYFLAQRGGGTEVELDKREMLVITPQSPLGQEMMGKRVGDKVTLQLEGKKNVYKIVQVF